MHMMKLAMFARLELGIHSFSRRISIHDIPEVFGSYNPTFA